MATSSSLRGQCLEALILKQVAGDFFALDAGEDGDA
jgi:hypothetical protein